LKTAAARKKNARRPPISAAFVILLAILAPLALLAILTLNDGAQARDQALQRSSTAVALAREGGAEEAAHIGLRGLEQRRIVSPP
jgi:hypothetical protein